MGILGEPAMAGKNVVDFVDFLANLHIAKRWAIIRMVQ